MAHGGARPGAGRKAGGANKLSKEAHDKAAASGEMPVEFLLRVMRDEEADEGRRIDCAKAVAPYLHPKRAPVDGDGKEPNLTLNIVTGVPRDDD